MDHFEDEARILSAMTSEKISPMLETAAPSGNGGYVRRYDGSKPLRICWSGSHEARKALPLLLQAIKLLPERDRIALDILGKGSETRRCSLSEEIIFTEHHVAWFLPYHEARQTMGQADILIHSSFREGTPHVVMEALGWGIPVICHDACGMASAVDDTCGITIPLMNQKKSINGFRDALGRILRDPGLVEQLSKGALQRACELSWDTKVREIADAYIKIITQTDAKTRA